MKNSRHPTLGRRLARRACWLGLLALSAGARDLYVNPATGTDKATGLAATAAGPDGPVQTIARALKLAGAGDTVHLAPAVYRESAVFHNRAGAPGRPLVLDGHGAILDGSEPLQPADWEAVAPGLYRNTRLIKADDFVLIRWFFLFDGRMNHMGRSSKGTHTPFKKPADLQPGEWTFSADEHAFYVRIPPTQQLADAHISAPLRANGVGLGGTCAHLVIRHLTATHVYNDGYNIHGSTRDVVFEDIRAFDCGDDGFSAHEDCEVRVDGFVASGNSTGICNINNSVSENDHVLIKDCLGHDLFFLDGGRHTVRNCRILSSALHSITVTGRPKEHSTCTLTLDNVAASRTSGSNDVAVLAGGVLVADHLTLHGLGLQVAGTATLRHSVVAGPPPPKLAIATTATWRAEHNVYDLRALQYGPTAYTPQTFPAYQHAAGQDNDSRWEPAPAAQHPPGSGADEARLPAAPPGELHATP